MYKFPKILGVNYIFLQLLSQDTIFCSKICKQGCKWYMCWNREGEERVLCAARCVVYLRGMATLQHAAFEEWVYGIFRCTSISR